MSETHELIRVAAFDQNSATLDIYKKQFCELESHKYEKKKYSFEYFCQGQDVVKKIRTARETGHSYAVVFIDNSDPEGQDGLWIAKQIRLLDKFVNIVIVEGQLQKSTAHRISELNLIDNFFYLKKPFDSSEILFFTKGLTAKWQGARDHEAKISDQTANLAMTNIALHEELDNHRATKDELEKSKETIQRLNKELSSAKVVMESMFGEKNSVKKELEETIITNVKELVEPNIDKLRETYLDPAQAKYVTIIESNLSTIFSPFMRNQSLSCFRFTNNEVNVAKLIIKGSTSKEICELLNLSKRTIDFYREKMRKKLGIQNSNISLKKRLQEIGSVQ